jgi:DNA polymerase Ligase (LigD)/DNA ligase OB-like domain/ATP dependent DNA ligase domain
MAKEYAPGIPDKNKKTNPRHFTKPEIWRFAIQKHTAKKAGQHYDLRLIDPQTGIAHSWASRYLPTNPGDKVLAVQQPNHTAAYSTWSGNIESGYGAGKVELHSHNQIEVTKSAPEHISFNVYHTNGDTARYSLINTGNGQWLFYNTTPTRETRPETTISKPKYKSISPQQIDFSNPNQILAPKIDGAMNMFVLKPGKPIETFSYRPSKKSKSKLIDHTFRVGLYNNVVPKTSKGDTVLLGEVFARDKKTGKVLSSRDTAARLLSNVWRSRELQQKAPLDNIVFDVVKYKGKSASDLPYAKKLEILQTVTRDNPSLHMPPLAITQSEKKQLVKKVQTGKHKLTEEGVVIYNVQEPVPVKAKLFHDYDVVIQKMFPGEGKYKNKGVGGFYYSHKGNNEISGKTGSGFSDELRLDMFAHPEKYIGQLVRVVAQEKLPSGALRMPVFKDIRSEAWPRHKGKKMDKAEVIMQKLSGLDYGAIWHDYAKPSLLTGAPIGAAVSFLTDKKDTPDKYKTSIPKAMAIGAAADLATGIGMGIWKQKKDFFKSLQKPVMDAAENVAKGI